MTKLKKDLDWWFYPSIPEELLYLVGKVKISKI